MARTATQTQSQGTQGTRRTRARKPLTTRGHGRPAPSHVSLREDFHPGARSPLKVDRDKRIIYRVKILGWESTNGRRYRPDAARDPRALYEGKKAFCNHPKKPNETRDVHDVLGIWHDPVAESDGVYADLHYLESHPMSARVVEDAERGLGAFGCSHNADGQGHDEDGVFVVETISEVRSVDLVADPATVTNLWESRKEATVKITTLRKLITEAKHLDAKRRAKLLEMGDQYDTAMMDDDMAAMPAADAGGDAAAAEDDGRAWLAKAIGCLVQSDEAGDHELAMKVMKLLKSETEPETTEEDAEVANRTNDADGKPGEKGEGDKEKVKEDTTDDGPDKTKKPSMPESRSPAAVAALKKRCEKYCKLAGLPADRSLVESLAAMGSDDAILGHLEWLRENVAGRRGSNAPRSQAPGGGRGGAAGMDAKMFGRAIKNGEA